MGFLLLQGAIEGDDRVAIGTNIKARAEVSARVGVVYWGQSKSCTVGHSWKLPLKVAYGSILK